MGEGMPERHIRVVSLWIHPGQEVAFEAFERAASRIMARYGGRIDRAVRVAAGQAGDSPFEVHVVSFPGKEAAESYAADPETVELRRRRDGIIARTEVLEGRAAGPY
jgi:uncharacterized protein (DUF1330 family)